MQRNVETFDVRVEELSDRASASVSSLLIRVKRRDFASTFYYEYNLHWANGDIGEYQSPEIKHETREVLRQKFLTINRSMASAHSRKRLITNLKNYGKDLYTALFSDEFDAIYWDRIRSSVKAIKIVSEDNIPWEFIRPINRRSQEIPDRQFLCDRFDISHWFVGSAPRDEIEIEELDLVKAIGDDFSVSEEASIQALLTENNIRFPLHRTYFQRCF